MKKYCNITLLFMIIISGCVKHKQIDFTSSETFFSSLNDKEIIQKENKENTPVINSLKINNEDKPLIKKPVLMNLSNYEKLLKQKIGFKEYKILKIFNNPNLKIKHGKVKNFQFHLKFCHLDLFFLNEDETYKFRHFAIRPSSMSSSLNKKKCFKELNSRFILIRNPK